MLKLLLEMVPLVVFLMTYEYSNIILATIIMIVTTSMSLAISYLIDRKISMPLLLSGVILIIAGGITILSGDSKYIKMKPTIVYIIFAAILWIGGIFQKQFVKSVFSGVLELEDKHWSVITNRFVVFLIFLAIINEIVWRNYSESFWVKFKVFGSIPLSILFMALQMPFIKQHNKKPLI